MSEVIIDLSTGLTTSFTSQEEVLFAKQSSVRKKRNLLLSSCDWTQVSDSPVDKIAWANYRQELRDITLQEGFPEVVIWPSPPQP